MALTTEELLLQMQILTEKADESTNPNMIYKKSKALNKGLNPEYYSGNNTKIVNILNDLFAADSVTTTLTTNLSNKINELLRDTSTEDGQASWKKLQEAMEQTTIIDGLNDLYEGKQAAKVLGLTVDDVDKILTVGQDDQGNAVLKAIDMIVSKPQDLTALDISYTNSKVPTVKNVKTALDNIFAQLASGNTGGGDGELGGDVIVGEITWDMINDKPNIGSKLSMTAVQGRLALLDENNTVISNVPLTTDSDIEEIINDFKSESEEE